MKKKICAILTVLLLITSIPSFAGAATAATGSNPAYISFDYAELSFSERMLYAMVESTNKTVENLVSFAQRTPYDDINFLIFTVKIVEKPVLMYADFIGANVVCEYETYYIDGKYIEIDPLRVISF